MLPKEIKDWRKLPRRTSLEGLWRFARLDGYVELACFGAGAHKPEGSKFTPYKGMCCAYTKGGVEGVEALIALGGDEQVGEKPLWGTGYYIVPAKLRDGVEARYVPDAWHVATNGTASEKDARSCNVLVVDVDPQRPDGTNSDKQEYLGALQLGWLIRGRLVELGVPEAALAYGSSGNGCHVVIALDAPFSPEMKASRVELLDMLGVVHDTSNYKIDPAMSDGARYIPLYGTLKKKGPNVEEREQRRSFLATPDRVDPLDLNALQALVVRLRESLTPDQSEALQQRQQKRPGVRVASAGAADESRTDRALDRCNAVSVSAVASQLGIDPEHPVCPACGAEKGIDCLEAKGKNIIKCQHSTCGAKAWSPVSLVMHALEIDTLKSNKEGTKAILSWFTSKGLIEGKRSRRAEAAELLRSEDISVDDDSTTGVLDALMARVPASARGEALAEALKPIGAVLTEADDLELDRVASALNERLGRGAPKKVLVDSLRKLRTAEKKVVSKEVDQGVAPKNGFARGDSVELAQTLLDGLGGPDVVVYDAGELHHYDDESGVWDVVTVARLHRDIGDYAGRPKGSEGDKLRLSRGAIEGARKQIDDIAANPDFFRDGRPGFAFANGFVSIDSKGEIQLNPHDPGNRARYRYDFDWDPERVPLKLIDFYGEIFKGDPEAAVKTQFLLEFYGASLIGEVWRAGKALIKCGGGNDGKSVETQIMQAVFPQGSVQGVSPHDWSNDQKLAKLASARLNYAGELSGKEIRDPEIVKAVITGRDLVMAKVVYREPFSFYVRAGHAMSSNLPLPGVSDTSRGFWRRWELIEFTRSFLPEEENGMIVEDVTEDRQAIACTLIQAAAQFVGNGCRFTEVPASSARIKLEWQSGAEPVRRWVTDACGFSLVGVTEDLLWSRFKSWAEDNRHMAMSSATFRGRLCSIVRDLARGPWADQLGQRRGEAAKAGYLLGPNGERRYPLTTPDIEAQMAACAAMADVELN